MTGPPPASMNPNQEQTVNILVHIDPENRMFTIQGGTQLSFPLTALEINTSKPSSVPTEPNHQQQFCLLIACDKQISLSFNTPAPDVSFNRNSEPISPPHGMLDQLCQVPIIPQLAWAPYEWKRMTESDQDIQSTYHATIENEISKLEIALPEKLVSNLVFPPGAVPIHVGFATQASASLINHQIRGLYRKYGDQWSTVSVTRLLTIRPELFVVTDPIIRLMLNRLFSVLVIPLEQFYLNRFQNGNFPFSMNEPVWSPQAQPLKLYMGLEREAQAALKKWTENSDFTNCLMEGLLNMSNSRYLHLICRPHISHFFTPSPVFSSNQSRTFFNGRIGIITFNSFVGTCLNSVAMHTSKEGKGTASQSPIIVVRGPQEVSENISNHKAEDLSCFIIDPTSTKWVFETPFELFLLLKNFIYLAKTPEHRFAARKIFLTSMIIHSPFLIPYFHDFCDFFDVSLPPSPFDQNAFYQNLLVLFRASLFTRKEISNYSDRLMLFFEHEKHVASSLLDVNIALHFPEFFSMEIPKPTKHLCDVPSVIIDPGAIHSNLTTHMLTLQLLKQHRTSLIGFPFWEVMPYWLRLSGVLKKRDDFIAPTITNTSEAIRYISNPTGLPLTINFSFSDDVPGDLIIEMADNNQFDNSTILEPAQLSQPVKTSSKDVYFSAIGTSWSGIQFTVDFPQDTNASDASGSKINVERIHDQFIDEMKMFTINWTEQMTDELVDMIPLDALMSQTFDRVESVVSGSSLAARVPKTVVLIWAMIIHHFNFIHLNHAKEVAPSIWANFSRLVSSEEAARRILELIVSDEDLPSITVNRHKAHDLIMDRRGSSRDSIIGQLTTIFRERSPAKFRTKDKPWRVSFVGEDAIDAGGPGRELLTEAASSIFEPTSGLFIPTPNGAKHSGPNGELYVPFMNDAQPEYYWSIGIVIGMIIRTGLNQDLPFAHFVWKYLAGEEIGIADFLCVDQALQDHITNMRSSSEDADFSSKFRWTLEGWNGKVVVLPRHQPGEPVKPSEIDDYINECFEYRMSTIKQPLQQMQKGFRENTKLGENTMLTGTLLSKMAQGSSIITLEHLKAITKPIGFPGDNDNATIKRFWRAVERFNDDQRRMFLKFTTTLTRLPNSIIKPNFKIQIDMLNVSNPDQSLPTASTCFNKLHLPQYTNDNACYEKLLYAIMYCQTMENS